MMALRIERLDFNPWGCFADHSLTFEGKAGNVELVYGPNASGKSTTSRGERSLLYGIEVRTSDAHTHPYQDLRIGARLNLGDRTVELSRRKRRGDSLSDPDGASVPQETLTTALGGLTEEVYRGLFQVDHDTLVKGGAELAQGKGEIGATLFAAAAGITTLHETLSALEHEAEALFSSRARSSTLRKALIALHDAEKRLREATLRPSRHHAMTRGLRQAEETCADLGERIREIERQIQTLERRRALAPLLYEHARRIEELDTLADVPNLVEGADAKRADAEGRLRAAKASLKRAKESCARLCGEIEAIKIDEPLLARAEQIGFVKDSISAITKASGDRRKREGELQQTNLALSNAATVIGVSEPYEIESLRRPASAHRALDAHMKKHEEIAARRSAAKIRVTDSERARREAQQELDNAPRYLATTDLESAIASALRASTLTEQIEQLQLDAERGKCNADERLTCLHPRPATLAQLRTLSVPSLAQAQRAAQDGDAIVSEIAALDKEEHSLDQIESELAEEHERIELVGAAPSTQELASARTVREQQWHAIHDGAANGAALSPSTADTYEQSVKSADQLADARTEHAAQIERSSAAEARAARLKRDRQRLAKRRSALTTRGQKASEAWESTWLATGLSAIVAHDALTWLTEREEILELERATEEQLRRAEKLTKRQLAHRDSLAVELTKLDEEHSTEASLESLLGRGQMIVAREREHASSQAAQLATLRAAEHALSNAIEDRDDADSAAEDWEQSWPRWRNEAGLPESATPHAAQEILRAVEEGLGLLVQKVDLERRIAGIDTDHEQFQSDVNRLCDELAPELSEVEPERAAATLHARLVAAERARERHEALRAQHADAGTEVAAIDEEIALASTELAALIATAGAQSAEELPEIEIQSARARTLRVEIADLERQIENVGEARFSELSEQGEEFDRDKACEEIEQFRESAEDLRVERDEHKEQLGESKRELASLETDTRAVAAAQDVELTRAAVRDAATAHAKAKLGSTVVRRAIERYRRLHQDPLLARSNQLFTRFTYGSCVELFVDVDERGRGVLMARQRDRTLLDIEAMSDGTREQLFLALRLAAIERYVAASGPVPVLFDDVFLESDEPRSERIFEALGELAKQTQVIVLTHHRHLIDVGRRALGDRLLVQQLPDSAPVLREAVAA
jgi:uncharacterized protein YhaN